MLTEELNAELDQLTTSGEPAPFGEWCVIELMGHRRAVGYVTEVAIAGVEFLRVDTPAAGGNPAVTQFYRPTAVYGIHPTTEAMVRQAAESIRPYQPLDRFDLVASGAPRMLEEDYQ